MSFTPPLLDDPPTLSSLQSHHSNSLQQRSAALDLRANSLSQAEAVLSTRHSSYLNRVLALEKLETGLRRETADLLDALSFRQTRLSEREERHAKRETALKKRLEELRQVLSDGEVVEAEFRIRCQQLEEVKKREREIGDDIERLEQRKREVEIWNREAEERRKSSITEAERMGNVVERVERVERSVIERESRVKEREERVEEEEKRVERYKEMERLQAPLRLFLVLVMGLIGGNIADVGEEVDDLVDGVLGAVKKLGRIVEEVRVQREELTRGREELKRKEKELVKLEKHLKSRERDVQVAESRVRDAGEDLKRVERKIEDAWKGVEEGRGEVEAREEGVRMREGEGTRREEKIRYKEKAVEQQERLLLKTDRSLKRALVAVAEREREVKRRAKEMEEEKEALRTLKMTVELKEDLLETRDLELTAREAEKTKRLEALLEQTMHKRERGVGEVKESQSSSENGGVPSSFRRTTNVEVENAMLHEIVQPFGNQSAPVESQSAVQGQKPSISHGTHQPATVRRQLAFDQTVLQEPPRAPNGHPTTPFSQQATSIATTGQPVMAPGTSNHVDNEDAESEAAAVDLLPELVGARALWREHILRLEAVVDNMKENTRVIKPHIQPMLLGVSSNLRGIREDIDASPEQSFDSPKMAYAAEQRRQMRWSAQMREQLDAFRDVAAGMLIALNKEEDSMLVGKQMGLSVSDAEPIAVASSENQSNMSSSGGDESSADMTVDATQTEEIMDEVFETNAELTTFAPSFQQFRGQMRSFELQGTRDLGHTTRQRTSTFNFDRQRPQRLDRIIESVAGEEAIRTEPATTSTVLIANVAQTGGISLLRELATLRNELEEIAGGAPRAS